ncbi:hypothetical protein [Amnibacterium kyonggiense]|uniref:Uncharacterized protein n=1 Tax=Amnibacterium kyonggiense TaxID=595671 RepID=A0A4R7FT17_9MICO|nr:hypothetical protein [Amnibacterium kyonggiense]TDS81035.1 hypothetical protein CLV52_1608 [Amnibacterium kyonggiense]
MSDTSSEPAKYVAEYLDGPLEGTTEHRFLEGGKPEERVTQYALVDGTDAQFEYVAGEIRELNGEQFVQYSFSPKDSDPLQGQADPNEESKQL